MVEDRGETGSAETVIDSVPLWDGASSVASLEACNGVTKCRGIIFSHDAPCRLSSFSCKCFLPVGFASKRVYFGI